MERRPDPTSAQEETAVDTAATSTVEDRAHSVESPPGGAAGESDGRSVLPVVRHRVTRRRIQLALGLLWLLDGALQLQPFMFTRGFATQIIAPSAAGQPGWVAWPVDRVASVIGSQPVLLDLVFAGVQLALGIGFLWPRTVRAATVCSVVWAGGIWMFGEGLGGLAGGKAALFTGAPGAAVLYGVLALAVWPGSRNREGDRTGTSGGVASWFPVAWVAIWLDMALLAVLPANRSVADLSGQVSGAIGTVPAWLGDIDRTAGRWVHDLGAVSVVLVAVVPVAIGLLGLGGPRRRRVAAWSGITVALVTWIVGESFGLLGSGMATDPNTGVLLALCGVALLGVTTPVAALHATTSWRTRPVPDDRVGQAPVGQAPVVGVA